MLHSKILLITGAEVFFIGFLVSFFNVNVPVPQMWPFIDEGDIEDRDSFFRKTETPQETNDPPPNPAAHKQEQKVKNPSNPKPKATTNKKPSGQAEDKSGTGESAAGDANAEPELRIFTAKELSHYDGSKRSKGLYLAILGKVFDVKKGSKHYGPRGAYHFFAGKDATRSFVSGDFTDSARNSDVSGLTNQDMLGIEEWMSFYEKQYPLVGYVHDIFYDATGQPTKKLRHAKKALMDAHKWRKEQANESARFPGCNSEWSQNKGGRVWCTNKSGGIARDWVGVPRKLFQPGSSQSRCACVRTTGPTSDADPGSPSQDKGDLDNPNLQEYADCNPDAISCALPADD